MKRVLLLIAILIVSNRATAKLDVDDLKIDVPETSLKLDKKMTLTLEPDGRLLSDLYEDPNERYTLYCNEEASYILVEPDQSILYRFRDTKRTTHLEKCESLSAQMKKFGERLKVEVVVNPAAGTVMWYKNILSKKSKSSPKEIRTANKKTKKRQLKIPRETHVASNEK